MWPLSLPVGESGRSRFTRDPARKSPRLLRRSVSGARSALNPPGRKFTAVKHTPFTAMLAPSVMSCITVEQRTASRGPAVSTVPSSSIIPVNIQVAFHGEFVRRYRMNRHIPDPNGVRPAPPPDAARQRQRLQSAQNLRPVVEEDPVHYAAFERRPIQLASRLDHQREIPLLAQ